MHSTFNCNKCHRTIHWPATVRVGDTIYCSCRAGFTRTRPGKGNITGRMMRSLPPRNGVQPRYKNAGRARTGKHRRHRAPINHVGHPAKKDDDFNEVVMGIAVGAAALVVLALLAS